MQVFLSYAASDAGFARELAAHLSRRGCDVWDPGERLFPGDNYAEKIGEALRQSKAMVVLLSPDSVRSEWVRREIDFAIGERNYEGRVFPVMVRPTKGVPWILRRFELVSRSTGPSEISRRIASALKRVA